MTVPLSSDPSKALNREEESLTLTVHAMPRASVTGPDRALSERQRRRGRLAMILVLLCCAAPVVASYLTYFVIRPEGRANHSPLIEPNLEWPNTAPLTTLDGKSFDVKSLKGQWLLVTVGPSACDEACEKRLFAQRQLREMLGRERDRLDKVFIVWDGAALPAALNQALSAQPPTLVLRAERAGVAAWLEQGAGLAAGTAQEHLYLVDPMGRWMMRTPKALEPAKFKKDMDRVLRASASWDRAGR
jgi:hypothetical protein